MPNLKILFLAAEADPLVKVGGLGDVAGSLPQALQKAGDIDIRLAIPYYGAIQERRYPLTTVATCAVPHRSGVIPAKIFTTRLNDLIVYFVSGAPIPPEAPVYSTDNLRDGYKFTFYSLAALQLAHAIAWAPDILHANDWHTAPAIYAMHRQRDPFFADTASLLGVHNLPYMGDGAGPALQGFNLPPAAGSSLPWWAQDMPLPLGLLSADHIVAASPTYSREILTPEFGSGLESFLKTRKAHISGILNGIDTSRWDPSTESAISAQYDNDHLDLRRENKTALLREFGLSREPDLPLLGMVTRMDPQKGIDLVPPALRMIEKQGWQAIFLGTGMPAVEKAIRRLEKDFPDRLRAAIRFDALLSRRIYAGADILLIPSRYEPCGLTQMIAMRYGCIPLARTTGGLKDTIRDKDAGNDSTGFLFKRATPQDLAKTIIRSFDAYTSPEAWRRMQRNGMVQDFSWERFARQYAALYQTLAENRQKEFSHGQ